MPYPVAACHSKSFAPSGSAAPPLPAFTSVLGSWAVNNFDPIGYPTGLAVEYNDGISADPAQISNFTESAPYPASNIGLAGSTPYLVNTWADQSAANNLLQTGSARPVFNYATLAIDFNGSSTGFATFDNVTFGGKFLILYLRFKAGSLSETSVLFETGDGSAGNAGIIRVSLVVGVLTVSVSDQTAVTALLNTKIKTISDTDWHLLSVVVDTTAVAANQVLCWLDGSQTGWTAPISTDLASENLTTAKVNVGARNNAASNFFTGSMSHLLMFSVAQGATLRGQWQDWINSLAFTPSSVLVAGAGTSAANGTYPYFSQVNGRAAYDLNSSADPETNGISWAGSDWRIVIDGANLYLSSDDTAFPWQATFIVNDGDSPAPTVSQV